MKYIRSIIFPALLVCFVSCGESKEEKAARERKEAAFRRKADSVENAYQESRKRANDSLLNKKKGVIDAVREFEKNYQDSKNEITYTVRKEPKLIEKSLKGSVYSASSDGCQATETCGSGNELKIELKADICKTPEELKYKIENPWNGGDPEKVKDWFMLLSMDLAALKARVSNTVYFHIEKAMSATLLAMNNDPASHPDQMRPVKFEGAEIHMNSMKSNGRSSTLEFTVLLIKTK